MKNMVTCVFLLIREIPRKWICLLFWLPVAVILLLFIGCDDKHSMENTGKSRGESARYFIIHSLDYTIGKFVHDKGVLPNCLSEVDSFGHLSGPDRKIPQYLRCDDSHGFLIWEGFDKNNDEGKILYEFRYDYLLVAPPANVIEKQTVTEKNGTITRGSYPVTVKELISGDLVLALSVVKDERGDGSQLAFGWLQPLSSIDDNKPCGNR